MEDSIPLLGAILLDRGKVQPEMLEHALQVQRASGTVVRLGEVLVQLGYVAEGEVQEALQMQRRMAEEVAGLLALAEERPTVLLVCEHEATETALRGPLAWLLYNLVRVDAGAAARRARHRDVQAMLWEVAPPEKEVVSSLQDWRRACPDLPLVVLVHEGCPARVLEQVLQAGADQVLVLPTEEHRLAWALRRAVGRQRLQERLEAQRARLNRMEQVLALLELLGQVFSATPDEETMLLNLAVGVTGLLEVEACLVQWDRRPGVAIAGPQASRLEGKLPEGLRRALEWCRYYAQPIGLDDVRTHPLWGNLAFELPGLVVRSLLCAPLCAGGRSIGAIAIINRLDGATFSVEEQQVLTALAGQVALALENAYLQSRAEPAQP